MKEFVGNNLRFQQTESYNYALSEGSLNYNKAILYLAQDDRYKCTGYGSLRLSKKIGFTLIELLIVMIIISIVAGIAVVTISSNQHKQFETLANQLVNSIQLAEQEAMLRPATLGLAFTENAFQFYTMEHNAKTDTTEWSPIVKSPLASHLLPNHTQMTLKLHGEVIQADGEPKLIIPPSNDLTPFVILIGKQGETPYYQITGKANGEVKSAIFQAE